MRSSFQKKPREMERNVVAKNTKIIGDVIAEGDFRIDGTLEGTLKTNGRIIIGIEGVVNGNVEAENADVEGNVSGKLMVGKTLTVKATATISGDVVIGKLAVEPGANFNATCVMKAAVKQLKNTDEQKEALQRQAAK